jgi:hypothetical protein
MIGLIHFIPKVFCVESTVRIRPRTLQCRTAVVTTFMNSDDPLQRRQRVNRRCTQAQRAGDTLDAVRSNSLNWTSAGCAS